MRRGKDQALGKGLELELESAAEAGEVRSRLPELEEP